MYKGVGGFCMCHGDLFHDGMGENVAIENFNVNLTPNSLGANVSLRNNTFYKYLISVFLTNFLAQPVQFFKTLYFGKAVIETLFL